MPVKNGVLRVPYPILGILIGVLIQIIMLAAVWGTTQANIKALQEQRREDIARQDERFRTIEGLIRDLYNQRASVP